MAVALRRALQYCRMFIPLAPAAQNLGVGLRRPSRGKVCGSKLGSMTRIAPPQPSEAMGRTPLPLFSAAAQRRTAKFWSQLRVDSFGVDSRFETACSSSAFNFFGLDTIFFLEGPSRFEKRIGL
jgi:hypothetical protein